MVLMTRRQEGNVFLNSRAALMNRRFLPSIPVIHLCGWVLSQDEKQDTEVRGMCTHATLLQSCPTLCDPVDCSPPGSSVHGILQARIQEWVAISSYILLYKFVETKYWVVQKVCLCFCKSLQTFWPTQFNKIIIKIINHESFR